MIDRQHGEVTIRCDTCDDAFDDFYLPDDFHAMIADAKRVGWKIERNGSDVTHTCPDCKKTSRLAEQRKLLGL